jgi:exopolysaccharide biosynthesis polyprenyl glycosylphosphotransferase
MFVRLRRLLLLLAAADFLGTQLALLAADFVRRVVPLGAPVDPAATFLNPFLHLVVAVVFPVAFLTLSVYNVRRDTRPVGDPVSLTRAVAVSVFVFAGVLYFSYRDVPRLLVIYFFFLTWATLAGVRLAVGLGLRYLLKQGRPLSRVLLVGAGETAEAVVGAVRARLGDSVVIVGCACDDPASAPSGLPVLGKTADVPELARTMKLDEVILALPSEQYEVVETLAYALLTQPVRVRLVPDYLRLVVVQSSVESLGGLPLIGLREPRIRGLAWATKRLFDLAMAAALLILTGPMFALIAWAIRRDSPGPVLFRQQRVGENGRSFSMYKFRTMVSDADMRRPEVALDEQGRQVYKQPDDARITRVGRFLRRTSLDELPQLINVVKGEMSLVGPRPEMQFIVDAYEPWQRQRLAVPPGITGWWQVNGRSDLPMHLNTQLDLYYIRNYSLWLDLKILWLTVGAVIQGRGAY